MDKAAQVSIDALSRVRERLRAERATQPSGQQQAEPPRPLMREMPAPDPFPTDALGPILANAAIGIQDRTQAPVAICGQSVLAAATLVAQGYADVKLPTGQVRPLSNYFATVGVTGERGQDLAVVHELLHTPQGSGGCHMPYTETWRWLDASNRRRSQSAHRWRSRSPARRAMRSSSAGQA